MQVFLKMSNKAISSEVVNVMLEILRPFINPVNVFRSNANMFV